MICLNFDVEEFLSPREHGFPIPLERQLDVSTRGTELVLELLKGFGVRATFYCTPTMAEKRPSLIKRIVTDGHQCNIESKSTIRISKCCIDLSSKTLRNTPLPLYLYLADKAIKRDGQLVMHFSTWEFTEDCEFRMYRLPLLTKRNTGQRLIYLLGSAIVHFKESPQSFVTQAELTQTDKMAEK